MKSIKVNSEFSQKYFNFGNRTEDILEIRIGIGAAEAASHHLTTEEGEVICYYEPILRTGGILSTGAHPGFVGVFDADDLEKIGFSDAEILGISADKWGQLATFDDDFGITSWLFYIDDYVGFIQNDAFDFSVFEEFDWAECGEYVAPHLKLCEIIQERFGNAFSDISDDDWSWSWVTFHPKVPSKCIQKILNAAINILLAEYASEDA